MTYPYILPPLPYAPAALEPNLGRSSVRLHHDAFFAAYVDRLNGALVPWTQYQDWPLERLLLHWCQLPRTLGQAVRRYGGGVYNHGLYFSSLAPARTTKPSGELLAEVEHSFGSVEGLHRSLKNAAMSVFGSGWVWLVCCSGGLQVTCTANQDTPLPLWPLFNVDLWEHAFIPDYENRREEPVLTISVRRAEQLTDELLRLRPALVYVPLDELAAHLEKAVGTEHTSIGVSLPRVAWDREYPGLREKLEQVRALGVKDALLGNLGMFPIARELGFTLRGDFGLEIYNAQALKEYKRLGLQSATLSFELKLAQIRDLSKCLDTELITYGRLPLMLMENCIIKNRTGSCGCQNTNILTDRKGARFPVVSAPGCRNELLNSQKLFLADRAADYRRIGLWAQRLLFTTENPRECVQVAQRYLEQGSWTPNEYTRGLYYRDVE